MSNFIQMFADKLKTIKGYPYTLEKAVFDDNGQSLENKLSGIKSDIANKIKIKDFSMYEDVSANVVKTTNIDYGEIPLDKIISTTITWNNPSSDTPTLMTYYRVPTQIIQHRWSVTQKVNFICRVAYFE